MRRAVQKLKKMFKDKPAFQEKKQTLGFHHINTTLEALASRLSFTLLDSQQIQGLRRINSKSKWEFSPSFAGAPVTSGVPSRSPKAILRPPLPPPSSCKGNLSNLLSPLIPLVASSPLSLTSLLHPPFSRSSHFLSLSFCLFSCFKQQLSDLVSHHEVYLLSVLLINPLLFVQIVQGFEPSSHNHKCMYVCWLALQ